MRILVVDDERNIRFTLRDILQDEGHTVLLAETGERALELAAEHPLDVVLLDVLLPGRNGLEVLKELRATRPEVDVIMISGHGTVGTAVQALQAGAYDFLEKPLSLARIQVALKNLKERRQLKRTADESRRQLSHGRYQMIGESAAMQAVKEVIRRVAPTEARVLIRGESGTGKELVAHAIHDASPRAAQPFVKFNAAALPSELVESELFGFEKGAFTGAVASRPGRLETADEGTLFLDEIGDMSLAAQAKILRVIEEGRFERLGSNKTIQVNVRILAATHKNLEELIKTGAFREDLYYRLNVVPINLPPLRERKGDIPLLLEHYSRYFAAELQIERKRFTPEAIALLESYSFPGNIRELRNLVERLYILVPDQELTPEHVKGHLRVVDTNQGVIALLQRTPFQEARREFEKMYLETALRRNGGNITRTARELGLHQPNLSKKLKELGLK